SVCVVIHCRDRLCDEQTLDRLSLTERIHNLTVSNESLGGFPNLFECGTPLPQQEILRLICERGHEFYSIQLRQQPKKDVSIVGVQGKFEPFARFGLIRDIEEDEIIHSVDEHSGLRDNPLRHKSEELHAFGRAVIGRHCEVVDRAVKPFAQIVIYRLGARHAEAEGRAPAEEKNRIWRWRPRKSCGGTVPFILHIHEATSSWPEFVLHERSIAILDSGPGFMENRLHLVK